MRFSITSAMRNCIIGLINNGRRIWSKLLLRFHAEPHYNRFVAGF
jgi:hypothetical protein